MMYLLFIIDLGIALASYFLYSKMPTEIPLFYSKPWGAEQIVPINYIIILPFLLHFFVILNDFLAKKLFKHNKFIKNIVIWVNISLVLFFIGAFAKVIFLVY